uniref:Uncharacterized protein n=1 Tax=Zea mays TaxID=4577 RepID=B4FE92_MAIZE|nr:unknown [Zea mays]
MRDATAVNRNGSQIEWLISVHFKADLILAVYFRSCGSSLRKPLRLKKSANEPLGLLQINPWP